MKKVTCFCGAVYREHEHKLTSRDNDYASCRICGEKLNSWNGEVMYSYELISEPAPDHTHEQDKQK